MTIDRNRIKLELLNFRNYAEIYADSRNLITEYERNDNKITTAERHDIRLTKLEKNAKALLLVDEYHRLLFDYSFRHRAVTGLLAEMPKFSRATYMSATPIEREFLLDELQTLPTTRIV